jgi:iron complex transport system substrate-binding protein
MRKTLIVAVLLCLLPAALAATFRDALGRSVEVAVPAERVVALSLTVTEVLFDIGVTPVGRPITAEHPPLARSVPDVGGAYTPDLEKIAAARPDVLVGSVGTTAAALGRLMALRIPVIVTPDSSLADVEANYALLGRLTGREAAAAAAVERFRARVAEAAARVPADASRPKVLAIIAAGGRTFAAGPETYVGDLLGRLGAANVAEGVPSADPRQPGFVILPIERIVAADPDVIIGFRPVRVSGDPAPSPFLELEASPAWRSLRAVSGGRVHLLDADPFVTAPGPRAPESMERLLPLLYPAGSGA